MKRVWIIAIAALALVDCRSIRVTGMVYDEGTGDWINSCTISTGPKSYYIDITGHYDVKTVPEWKTLTFVCPRYETVTMPVRTSSRFWNVNVPMKRRDASPVCDSE